MTLNPADNPLPCFPENLFQKSLSDERVWWVARTKSRQEKALAWTMKGRGMPYFLPLVARPQKCRGRMRSSIVPLFNGYLFFKGSKSDRYEALKSGRIAQLLEVENQSDLHRELATLALASANSMHLELCDFVKKGQRVRIVDGPFKGMEGIVKKHRNRARLVLNVEAIQQAASIEIALDQAQPI